MEILKSYSHKSGEEILRRNKLELVQQVELAIRSIHAVDCLRKVTREASKVRKWGGLLFSPRAINAHFREHLLIPYGWISLDERGQRYVEPTLRFSSSDTIRGADRYRKMDGIKDRTGLEVQLGKYAFMGYDIFSKMIIFKNAGLIDYGIEIVLVQDMIDCMSTGVSAFEHIMIDFEYRGEADIDIPVWVVGVGPTEEEWNTVFEVQQLFREDPDKARAIYPDIGLSDLKGTRPGPK